MRGHGELCDTLRKIIAQLYVLRESCTGKIETESSTENLSWFQGAQALLKEAVDNLQNLHFDLGELTSMTKSEGNNWTDVERLIRKLDDSAVSDSLHS